MSRFQLTMSEQQKVVLITGASSGIGKATALEYAKLGYRIAITGRDRTRLDEVLASLVAQSPDGRAADFLALRADFEYPAQVEPIVSKTVDKFGQLDVLINNAGCTGNRSRVDEEAFFEDFRNVLQVNLLAATRLAHLATPHLLKTKGVIINVSSVSDRIPKPTVSYSVSKAALTMLSKSLANGFKGTGVRVVNVAPGPTRTEMRDADMATRTYVEDEITNAVPLQRFGEVADVAGIIVFLTSDKASYINGTTIDIDGGFYNNFGGLYTRSYRQLSSEES